MSAQLGLQKVAGLIFSLVMLGAIFMTRWSHGWNSINMGGGNEGKGMEFQVLILAVSLSYLIQSCCSKEVARSMIAL